VGGIGSAPAATVYRANAYGVVDVCAWLCGESIDIRQMNALSIEFGDMRISVAEIDKK
jgi:hypothetical protein